MKINKYDLKLIAVRKWKNQKEMKIKSSACISIFIKFQKKKYQNFIF